MQTLLRNNPLVPNLRTTGVKLFVNQYITEKSEIELKLRLDNLV